MVAKHKLTCSRFKIYFENYKTLAGAGSMRLKKISGGSYFNFIIHVVTHWSWPVDLSFLRISHDFIIAWNKSINTIIYNDFRGLMSMYE